MALHPRALSIRHGARFSAISASEVRRVGIGIMLERYIIKGLTACAVK